MTARGLVLADGIVMEVWETRLLGMSWVLQGMKETAERKRIIPLLPAGAPVTLDWDEALKIYKVASALGAIGHLNQEDSAAAREIIQEAETFTMTVDSSFGRLSTRMRVMVAIRGKAPKVRVA